MLIFHANSSYDYYRYKPPSRGLCMGCTVSRKLTKPRHDMSEIWAVADWVQGSNQWPVLQWFDDAWLMVTECYWCLIYCSDLWSTSMVRLPCPPPWPSLQVANPAPERHPLKWSRNWMTPWRWCRSWASLAMLNRWFINWLTTSLVMVK